MTYRVSLSASSPAPGDPLPVLLAAEEFCEQRGWRLHALSFNEGRWAAIVDSPAPRRAIESVIGQALGQPAGSAPAVWALSRSRDRELAILDIARHPATALFIAGA